VSAKPENAITPQVQSVDSSEPCATVCSLMQSNYIPWRQVIRYQRDLYASAMPFCLFVCLLVRLFVCLLPIKTVKVVLQRTIIIICTHRNRLLSRRSRQRERLHASNMSICSSVYLSVCLSVCLSPNCKKTRFSQKLNNLELWCLLTTYRTPYKGFSKNPLLDP